MHSTVPPSATGTAQAKPCGCQSVGQPCQCQSETTTQTCCELVCFERPRYFCGHLLRDEDLMREQRYFREKNKLYHRTLHGHGVVCGLRLTCHPRCNGQILIGDGYAIDDCGNDLVVCDPLAFDVLGELRRLGWLDNPPPPDPCQKEEEKGETDDCKIRTCYYVTLCYDEQESDFTTPFVTSCGTGPQTCEATRVREGVRVELRTTLPASTDPMAALCQRITGCLKLFTDSEFLTEMQKNKEQLSSCLNGTAKFPAEGADHSEQLFCRLRALLLLYLRRHPEPYSCLLQADVEKLTFVAERNNNYGNGVRTSFYALFALAQEHVWQCVLNEMIFACDEPCASSCVVLGTVIVENGQLRRVSNYPRDYVWSFASLLQVLPAWVMNETLLRQGSKGTQTGHAEKPGCADLPIEDSATFVAYLLRNPKALEAKFCTMFTAASLLRRATQRSFDVTRHDTFSPDEFKYSKIQEAEEIAKQNGLRVQKKEVQGEVPELAPFEAMGTLGLKTSAQALTFLHRDGLVVAVQPEVFPPTKLDDAEQKQWEEKFTKTNQQLKLSHKQITELQIQLKEKGDSLTKLGSRLESIEALLKNIPIPPNMQPPKGGKKGGGK